MRKIDINGTPYVALYDICDILRHIEELDMEISTKRTVKSIARMMFYDEYVKAETDEEKEAAIELPGTFVVCRKLNENEIFYFKEWTKDENGERQAVFTPRIKEAMVFIYEGMADHVAEIMNTNAKQELFKVTNVGVEDGRIVKRILNRIFNDPEEEEETDVQS